MFSLAHCPLVATGGVVRSPTMDVDALCPPATARITVDVVPVALVLAANCSPNAMSQVAVGRSTIPYVDVAAYEAGIGGPTMKSGLRLAVPVSVTH